MIYYKTVDEIEFIKQSSLIVSGALAEVAKAIKPGITTIQLDLLIDQYIRDLNAEPAFKGYRDFPKSSCISVNEEVVHGIPSDRVLKEQDIVSVDIGVKKNNYFGDSAYTFAIGEISDDHVKVMRVTYDSLYKGIEQAKSGNRIGDISWAIQNYVETQNGFGVVRDLVGHGIGRNLHEEPEVPNYGGRGRGPKIQSGLVIAIEPMVNRGTKNVKQAKDGWTIYSADKSISAHFEHTVAVMQKETLILSDFLIIEEAVKNNKELRKLN